MPDKVLPGPVQGNSCIKEAVCIHTKKIYDSCRDKDCIADLRVFPTCSSQSLVDGSAALRAKGAELLCVEIDVEAALYTNGCYAVNLRYYYKITADVPAYGCKGPTFEGLAVFDKKVILYGGVGGAKSFSSTDTFCNVDSCKPEAMPEAIVEALDPIILDIGIVEICNCHQMQQCEVIDIPDEILSAFDEPLYSGDSTKRVLVTLGQFSTVRLERNAQLLVPVYDHCIPEKECVSADNISDPCELFEQFQFPVESFLPSDGDVTCGGIGNVGGAGNTCCNSIKKQNCHCK